jgi:phage terminase large subunit-like protein
MARGFESKDVEFQQAEAERRATPVQALSADERIRQASRHTLELALTHARQELAATTAPIRRDTLTQAITDLERQLAS